MFCRRIWPNWTYNIYFLDLFIYLSLYHLSIYLYLSIYFCICLFIFIFVQTHGRRLLQAPASSTTSMPSLTVCSQSKTICIVAICTRRRRSCFLALMKTQQGCSSLQIQHRLLTWFETISFQVHEAMGNLRPAGSKFQSIASSSDPVSQSYNIIVFLCLSAISHALDFVLASLFPPLSQHLPMLNEYPSLCSRNWCIDALQMKTRTNMFQISQVFIYRVCIHTVSRTCTSYIYRFHTFEPKTDVAHTCISTHMRGAYFFLALCFPAHFSRQRPEGNSKLPQRKHARNPWKVPFLAQPSAGIANVGRTASPWQRPSAYTDWEKYIFWKVWKN